MNEFFMQRKKGLLTDGVYAIAMLLLAYLSFRGHYYNEMVAYAVLGVIPVILTLIQSEKRYIKIVSWVMKIGGLSLAIIIGVQSFM